MLRPMKCNVCNINNANQTGAHIFPAWMIASAFSDNGITRDYEIIFGINDYNADLEFIGKSVLPEKINDTLGKELNEIEIQNQKNPFVVDNLWCSVCEKRISQIEEYFLINVHRKTNNYANNSKLKITELKSGNKYLIRLFFYSLFLRADISKFMNFQICRRTHNKIKKFLTHYLRSNIKETINTIEKSENRDQLLKYPIRCIKTQNKTESASNFVYVQENQDKPYFFVINNYIIQFYGKGNRMKFKPNNFFGLSKIIHDSLDFKNYKEQYFTIALMNSELWEILRLNRVKENAKILMNNMVELYKSWYRKTYKINPDRKKISRFLNYLIQQDKNPGTKYSSTEIINAMKNSITE